MSDEACKVIDNAMDEIDQLRVRVKDLNALLDEANKTHHDLLKEHSKALGRVEGLDSLKGLSTPWPLSVVLRRLIATTEHLLDHHSCDCMGHEGRKYASIEAKAYMEMLE